MMMNKRSTQSDLQPGAASTSRGEQIEMQTMQSWKSKPMDCFNLINNNTNI